MAKEFNEKGKGKREDKKAGEAPKKRVKSGKKPEAPSFNRYRSEKGPSDFNEKAAPSRERGGSRPYKKTYEKKKPTFRKPENTDAKKTSPQKTHSDNGLVRLNKYLSNAGICSRREADELISSGVVKVNGVVITEMGYKIKPTDIVNYGGQTLKKERLVYLI